ncbi:MAG: hypothetical protein ABII27_02930 [bacterium]
MISYTSVIICFLPLCLMDLSEAQASDKGSLLAPAGASDSQKTIRKLSTELQSTEHLQNNTERAFNVIYVEIAHDRTYLKVQKILREQGYTVITKGNSHLLETTIPALAVLSKVEVQDDYYKLKALNPNIRVLLIDVYGDTDSNLREMGADFILSLNFEKGDLVDLMNDIKRDIVNSTIWYKKMENLPESSRYRIIDSAELSKYVKINSDSFSPPKHFVKDNFNGIYYAVKYPYKLNYWQKRLSSKWEEKNEFMRDYVAYKLLRILLCNVCYVMLPSSEESALLAKYIEGITGNEVEPSGIHLVKLSNSYSLQDEEVIQKDFKKAFTRNLIGAIVTRKWDFHAGNSSYISGSKIGMMFDNEQSFNGYFIDMNMFVSNFVNNYFGGIYEGININNILKHIDMNELRKTVSNFVQLDLAAIFRQIQSELNPKYDQQLKELYNFMFARQTHCVNDIELFFTKLFDWNKNKGLIESQSKIVPMYTLEELIAEVRNGSVVTKKNTLPTTVSRSYHTSQ